MRPGTMTRCWQRCGGRCCPRCRSTVPWWHGSWMTRDFPRQGKHSVGVARQYCGQIGKHDNCQAAVSLSVSTWSSSLPIAWRLYLPEVWCQDGERRQQAGVPEEIEFATKPEIALEQIRQAMEQKVPAGVVLADAGYGNGTPFRRPSRNSDLSYVVGIDSSTTVWEPGQATLASTATETRPRVCPQDACSAVSDHQPVSVKQLACLVTGFSVEGDRLAPGQPGNFALSIRRGPRAPSPSRL